MTCQCTLLTIGCVHSAINRWTRVCYYVWQSALTCWRATSPKSVNGNSLLAEKCWSYDQRFIIAFRRGQGHPAVTSNAQQWWIKDSKLKQYSSWRLGSLESTWIGAYSCHTRHISEIDGSPRDPPNLQGEWGASSFTDPLVRVTHVNVHVVTVCYS